MYAPIIGGILYRTLITYGADYPVVIFRLSELDRRRFIYWMGRGGSVVVEEYLSHNRSVVVWDLVYKVYCYDTEVNIPRTTPYGVPIWAL